MFNTTVTPKTLRAIIIMIILLIVVILTLFQLRYFVTGAEIMIDSEHYETSKPWFDVVFMVENTKHLTVQGTTVVPEVNGLVEQRIYLSPGTNTILISAQDPYGSTNTKKIYIVYPQETIKPDINPVF